MIPQFLEDLGDSPDVPEGLDNHLVRLRKQQYEYTSYGVALLALHLAITSYFIPIDIASLAGRALFSAITGGSLMNGLRLHIEIRELE